MWSQSVVHLLQDFSGYNHPTTWSHSVVHLLQDFSGYNHPTSVGFPPNRRLDRPGDRTALAGFGEGESVRFHCSNRCFCSRRNVSFILTTLSRWSERPPSHRCKQSREMLNLTGFCASAVGAPISLKHSPLPVLWSTLLVACSLVDTPRCPFSGRHSSLPVL